MLDFHASNAFECTFRCVQNIMFELRRLRHLLALVEHGHFGRAAEAVHLTQPALSRSIQCLESEAGAQLLQRQRGAIELTEIGRVLLRHAAAMVAGARDLERDLQLARGLDIGELRVGVGPYGGAALVGPVVGRLSQAHPRLQIRLVVAPWQELPERVRAREVDLVIAELSEIRLLEDFEHRPLSRHPTVFVCRAAHPLATLAAVHAEDLYACPLAAPKLPEHALRSLLAAMPARLRESARKQGPVTIECDSAAVLKDILLASDAISNMPRFMLERELAAGLLVALPAPDIGLRVQFGAAWLVQRPLGGAAGKLVEWLVEHDVAMAASAPQAARKRGRRPAG